MEMTKIPACETDFINVMNLNVYEIYKPGGGGILEMKGASKEDERDDKRNSIDSTGKQQKAR
jgi:hypothetical protein